MARLIWIHWVGLSLALVATLSHGGDPALGKQRAAACAGCHGAAGIATAPNYPNLAGQKEAYLVKAMQAYRKGERNDPIMGAMVAPLSDADVENLATYFAGLQRR
jgi:cytochrome c553